MANGRRASSGMASGLVMVGCGHASASCPADLMLKRSPFIGRRRCRNARCSCARVRRCEKIRSIKRCVLPDARQRRLKVFTA
jgi:hypothetical protein